MDQDTNKHKLKKGKFTRARGGTSKFLLIRCTTCNTKILLYQKDGPGNLFRLYLDKIHAPAHLAQLQNTCENKAQIPPLICLRCGEKLGRAMLYKPEKRLAYGIIRGKLHSEKSDGTF
jgi:DNA-directed RNA polymerase subunit RPC12/RpoP